MGGCKLFKCGAMSVSYKDRLDHGVQHFAAAVFSGARASGHRALARQSHLVSPPCVGGEIPWTRM
eukprot:9479448-Pyramimonas_sp.AAC.1